MGRMCMPARVRPSPLTVSGRTGPSHGVCCSLQRRNGQNSCRNARQRLCVMRMRMNGAPASPRTQRTRRAGCLGPGQLTTGRAAARIRLHGSRRICSRTVSREGPIAGNRIFVLIRSFYTQILVQSPILGDMTSTSYFVLHSNLGTIFIPKLTVKFILHSISIQTPAFFVS